MSNNSDLIIRVNYRKIYFRKAVPTVYLKLIYKRSELAKIKQYKCAMVKLVIFKS